MSRAFPELYAAALGKAAAVPVGLNPTLQGARSAALLPAVRRRQLRLLVGLRRRQRLADGLRGRLPAGTAKRPVCSVPQSMKSRAIAWLAGRFASAGSTPADIAGNAYAAVVLARAGRLDLSQLRYVSTRDDMHLPSEIARVQLVAALTHAGERDLATALLRQPPVTRDPRIYLNDYGSPLRDRAMALSLAAEGEAPAGAQPRRAGGRPVPTPSLGRPLLEHTGRGLGAARCPGALRQRTARRHHRRPQGHRTQPGRSRGAARPGPQRHGRQSRDRPGVPVGRDDRRADRRAARRGQWLQREAQPVPSRRQPPSTSPTCTRTTSSWSWSRERWTTAWNARCCWSTCCRRASSPTRSGLSGSDDSSSFAWLKDLSEPTFKAVRDDRYLAGFDLNGNDRAFKLAYVVRAVTPGTYARPGVQV